MSSFLESREIRIFISSTFKDMQEERNELVSKVFPLLRKMAKERQVTLTEIDLRWGITEEEAQQSKVVQICLEEIERSHPFFIGLLGGRYGWVPGEENSDWEKIIPGKYSDTKKDISEGKSMTEIEILHGVLRNSENIHASFYLREMPDIDIEPTQKDLRELVIQQDRFPYSTYTSAEKLGEKVIEDFSNLLDKLFPKEEYTVEIKRKGQLNALQQLTRNYVAIPQLEAKIDSFANQKSSKGLLVNGETGMGKSSLLANTALNLSKSKDCDVIAFFPQVNVNGDSFNDLAVWICENLQKIYDFDFNPEKPVIAELERAAFKIKPEKPLFLIIAGVDRISPAGSFTGNLVWWPEWNENVKIIFSADTDSESFKNLQRFDFSELKLKALRQDQRVDLARKYLREDFHKQLSDRQIELIGKSNPLFENTGVFVAFLDEIRKFGSFEELTQEIEELSALKDIIHFYKFIINKQASLFEDDEAFRQFTHTLILLVLSENGMSEEDLMEITGISRLNLSILMGINDSNFISHDGILKISNPSYKIAVEKLMLTDPLTVEDYRMDIVDHCLNGEEETDANGEIQKVLLGRKLFELAFQLYNLKDYDNLFLIISEASYYKEFKDGQKLNEFGKYWRALLDEDPYRYDFLALIYSQLEKSNSDSPLLMLTLSYISMSGNVKFLQELANFAIFYLQRGDIANRILSSLAKLIENEYDEFYEELKTNIKKSLAASSALEGDLMKALKSNLALINSETSMADDVISNIGDSFLSLYENTRNESFLKTAQDIFLEVLSARLKKYSDEANKELATAYSNYSAAMLHSNREYAVEMAKKGLKIYEKIGGFYDIDVAIQNFNIAVILNPIDPAKAISFAEDALLIYTKLLGEDAEKTNESRLLAAIILARLDRPYDSLTQLKIIKPFIERHPHNSKEFIDTITRVAYKFYELKDYDKAIEAYKLVFDTPQIDTQTLILYNGNMGKMYLLKGEYELSDRYYKEAINISQQNELYEDLLKHLIYLSQSHYTRGDYKEAKDNLRKVIEITEEKNLGSSAHLAYAYYNLSVMEYSDHTPVEEVIRMVRKAISIREEIGEEDSPDLIEYRETLEKLKSISGYVDEPVVDSKMVSKDIEKMLYFLDGKHEEILNRFLESLNALMGNHPEEALHHIEFVTEDLSDKKIPVALALSMKYQGLIRETLYQHSNGRKEDPQRIFDFFRSGIHLTEKNDEYSLAEDICLEMAYFCRVCKDLDAEEACRWKYLEILIKAGDFLSLKSAMTLYDICVVLLNRDFNSNLVNAIINSALFIFFKSQSKDPEFYKKITRLKKKIQSGDNTAEAEENNDQISDKDFSNNLLVISGYVESNKQENLLELSILLLTESLKYTVNDPSLYIPIELERIRMLIFSEDYISAVKYLNDLISTRNDYITGEYAGLAVTYLYVIYLALHDFKTADEVFEKNNIDQELKSHYFNIFTPLYNYLLLGEEEKAYDLYEDLTLRGQEIVLNEAEYYDMALYNAFLGREHEARHFLEIWIQEIEHKYPDDLSWYNPAVEFIKDLIK